MESKPTRLELYSTRLVYKASTTESIPEHVYVSKQEGDADDIQPRQESFFYNIKSIQKFFIAGAELYWNNPSQAWFVDVVTITNDTFITLLCKDLKHAKETLEQITDWLNA